MGAISLARSSEAPNPMQAHNRDASSGEVYETDLLIVDIKPEIYAQNVFSTSQNPHVAWPSGVNCSVPWK